MTNMISKSLGGQLLGVTKRYQLLDQQFCLRGKGLSLGDLDLLKK